MPDSASHSEVSFYIIPSIFYNEYRTEDDKIVKYRCHRHKDTAGDEGTWIASEEMFDSWAFDDPALPEIIRKHIAG